MIHVIKKITPLNKAINNFFIAFKSDIISKTDSQWNEEDYRGSSFTQWRIMKYYYLLHLMILLFLEVERTKELELPWSYYESKFDLSRHKKCLSCDGISIEKGYEAFGLIDLGAVEGIEFQEIELSNIVGDSGYIKSSTLVKDLILVPNICVNNIEQKLVPQGEINESECDDFDEVQDPGFDNDDEIIDD